MRASAESAVSWIKKKAKNDIRDKELAKPGLFYAGQDPTILKREDQQSLKLSKKLKLEKGWVMVGGLVKAAGIDSGEWNTADDWAPVSKAFAESLTSGTAYFVYFRPPTMHPNVWSDYELPGLLLNPHVHEVKTREVDSHGNWVTNDWVEIKKATRENPLKTKSVAGQGSHISVAGSSSPKTMPKKH